MTRLDRYLARVIISNSLMTLALLLPLLTILLFAEEMDQVGTGEYDLWAASQWVLLSLPRYVYQIFPLATLIGALAGLGNLASRSELVAMRAAGISLARIMSGALGGGVVLALAVIILGEWVMPAAAQYAVAIRASAQTGQAVQITATGLWVRDGNQLITVRTVLSPAQLRDITIYELDGTRLRTATHAAAARYEQDHWVLETVARSQLELEQVRVEQQAQVAWHSLLKPDVLKMTVLEPQALSIRSVWRYLQFLEASQQDTSAYAVALWTKLVQPLLVFTMIFVTSPLLVTSARSVSLGLRIFLGIPIGIAFYVMSRTCTYLALLFGLHPAVAALLPPLLFIAAAIWLLHHAHLH